MLKITDGCGVENCEFKFFNVSLTDGCRIENSEYKFFNGLFTHGCRIENCEYKFSKSESNFNYFVTDVRTEILIRNSSRCNIGYAISNFKMLLQIN